MGTNELTYPDATGLEVTEISEAQVRMSAGVLVVLDSDRGDAVMARAARYKADHAIALERRSVEARAAVAELIEAAAEVRASHRELPSADHPADVRQAGEARIGRAHYALEAALARAQGGAA